MSYNIQEYELKVKANIQAVIDAIKAALPNTVIVEQKPSINQQGYDERKLYVDFKDNTEFIIVRVS
jgi:hypothetical protein